jgi:hypothetical protein
MVYCGNFQREIDDEQVVGKNDGACSGKNYPNTQFKGGVYPPLKEIVLH